jgi:hypothetical protein
VGHVSSRSSSAKLTGGGSIGGWDELARKYSITVKNDSWSANKPLQDWQ